MGQAAAAAIEAQKALESIQPKRSTAALKAIGVATACWVAWTGINWMRGTEMRRSVHVLFTLSGVVVYMLSRKPSRGLKESIAEKKKEYLRCLNVWLESPITLFEGESGETTLQGEDARKFRLAPAHMLWPKLTLQDQVEKFPAHLNRWVVEVWGGPVLSKKESDYFARMNYYDVGDLSENANKSIRAVVGDFNYARGAWMAVRVREKLKESSKYTFCQLCKDNEEKVFDAENAHTFIRNQNLLDPVLIDVGGPSFKKWVVDAGLQAKVIKK